MPSERTNWQQITQFLKGKLIKSSEEMPEHLASRFKEEGWGGRGTSLAVP